MDDADGVGVDGAMRRNARLGAFVVGPMAARSPSFAVKDLIDVAGLPTFGGGRTPLAAGAKRSAHVVERLLAAGYGFRGKTATVELAFGGWGTNAATGTPWNPWDLRTHRAPGGSSSGSAVAVAAGLCDIALGTDTGGSVRIPASLCGVVGLKPSFDMVGRRGLHLLAPSMDVVGPLARTVAEAALALEAISGPDASDPATAGFRRFALGEARGIEPGRLVFACHAAGSLGDLGRDVAGHYRGALAILARLGLTMHPAAVPFSPESYVAPTGVVIGAEGWRRHGEWVDRHAARMDPWVVERFRAGDTRSALYDETMARRARDRASIRHWFDETGVDIVVTPATPIAAPPLTEIDEASLPLSRFTRAANYLDLPAIAVPMGLTRDGLPVGLQFIGHARTEAVIVAAALAFERARWPHGPPRPDDAFDAR